MYIVAYLLKKGKYFPSLVAKRICLSPRTAKKCSVSAIDGKQYISYAAARTATKRRTRKKDRTRMRSALRPFFKFRRFFRLSFFRRG